MVTPILHVLSGFAETDITPTIPASCELVGFYRPDNTAQGVLHRLKSQVLILKSEMQSCCIITIDSIGFTNELTNRLRDRVAKKLGALREQVMVCFSHTHAAPDAAANDGAYFQFAYERILKAVDQACTEFVPIKAAWGIAENTIGVNRRADAVAMDKRLGVLRISDADSQKTKVLLLRIPAHANVLTSDNFLISSDFFGTTRELLEKEYGCNVMLTQGASGNIRPKYRQENADLLEVNPSEAAKIRLDEALMQKYFKQSLAALEKIAGEIYRSVEQIWEQLIPVPIYRLTMFSEMQAFSADVPSMKRAVEIAAEAGREAGIDGTEWLETVKQLHENQVTFQETTKEIQYFVVNDGCLCGIADEPMCEIALDIQQKAANDFIFFGGYTNGSQGYLSTAEEYDKGGYEVLWSNLIYFKYYGRVMPLNRDTADKLADIVARKWNDILTRETRGTTDAK